MKKVALLGSTGSIGKQTLDVISSHPDRFKASILTAGSNVELLIQQAKMFHPEVVVIADTSHYHHLKESLRSQKTEVYAGYDDIIGLMKEYNNVDIVMAAIVGYAGLKPVVSALESGKQVALANKETLVVAGSVIQEIIKEKGNKIIPVDSEHSAIFQCLEGESHDSIDYITITASGGPFLNLSEDQLVNVKPEDALKHPKWVMGDKITIDSASLMNKGLEVIEAKWLFDLAPEQIKVVIHPQSIVHSFVHFIDGSVKAQLGLPDMRVPIIHALGYPERIRSSLPRVSFPQVSPLSFFEPDLHKFRNLSLALQALKRGGNATCILNAANEVAVSAFLSRKIGFMQMSDIIEHALEKNNYLANPTLDDLEETDKAVRMSVERNLNNYLV